MSDYRDLLERERRRHAMPDGSLEGLQRRRSRKRRNGQILAGVLALLIAAAGVGGGLLALRSSTGPKPVGQTPTPTSTPAPDGQMGPSPVSGPILFIDDAHGWMVDLAGQILATADGGKSWEVQLSRESSNINAVQFVDLLHGWGVGEGGLIHTDDGGAHWVTWSNQMLQSVQFLTPMIGWGVEARSGDPTSIGPIMRSDDGGVTWTPTQIEGNSVCFTDERFGWAAGPHEAGFSVYRTEDAGETWTEVPVSMPGGDLTGWKAIVQCGGDSLGPPGDALVWVVVQGDGGAGHVAYAVFRANPGGDVEPCIQDAFTHPLGQDKGIPEANNPYPGPLAAPDHRTGRFVTWCPACGGDRPFVSIERTQDGGATWTNATIVDSSRPGMPVGISFIDRDNGWILLGDLIGDQSNKAMVVLRTTDGGQTWGEP